MQRKNIDKRSNRRTIISFFLVVLISSGLAGCEIGPSAKPTSTPLPPNESPILPTNTALPTITRTLTPTATIVLETPTPDYRYECIPFEVANETLTGEVVCVYGEIILTTTGGGYASVLRFEDLPNTLLVRSVLNNWESYKVGDCIMAAGELYWNGEYVYLELDQNDEGLEIMISDLCD
jgi:hypothetical protein